MTEYKEVKPYLCACGQRFANQAEFDLHWKSCTANWEYLGPVDADPVVFAAGWAKLLPRLPAPPTLEQVTAERDTILSWLEQSNRLLVAVYDAMPANLRNLDLPAEDVFNFTPEMLKALRAVVEAWPIFIAP